MTRNPLRRLGWWILDYLYAAERQLRALVGRTHPEVFLGGSQRPVVVIPGVYESWRFLEPLVRRVHDEGHPVHVVEELGWNLSPVLEGVDHVVRHLVEHDLSDVVIVAHSKGGLIGKGVMTSPEGRRVAAMVAVATPFAGSRYSTYLWPATLRAFSPRDATIRRLARERGADARITSVYAAFDPHIPGGSELVGAANIVMPTGGHFRILADPAVLAVVSRVVAGAQPELPEGVKPVEGRRGDVVE